MALAIGTDEFTISCYGISLGGFDLILGVEFLCTLGPILWDFEDLCMAFTWGAPCILWKGLGSPHDDIWEPVAWVIAAAPPSHYWTDSWSSLSRSSLSHRGSL